MSHSYRRQLLRRLVRVHFWITFFSFVAYLLAGFCLGPGFFARDFSERIRTLADDVIVVTGIVHGPPEVPVVSATPICVGGAPRVILDWADDPGTDTWDIERDALWLVTGLVSSQYTDAALVSNTTYTYGVTAYGDMGPGSATSIPVVVTTLDCPNQPAPVVTIQTVAGLNVGFISGGISVTELRPEITGTTNMPGASVTLTLTNPAINLVTTASPTGYFVVTVPVNLNLGEHLLTVVVVDQYDPGRSATDSLTFLTPRPQEDDDEDEDEDEDEASGRKRSPEPALPSVFGFGVRVDNPGARVTQGDLLTVTLTAGGHESFPKGAQVDVFVVDLSGKDILRVGGAIIEEKGRHVITFTKLLPLSFVPGAYQVRGDVVVRGTVASRFAAVQVVALPLIDLGGGAVITYAEAAGAVGSVFLFLLFLWFLFLLLFVREYWLYLHSLRHITERHLERFGFFGSRKGVVS